MIQPLCRVARSPVACDGPRRRRVEGHDVAQADEPQPQVYFLVTPLARPVFVRRHLEEQFQSGRHQDAPEPEAERPRKLRSQKRPGHPSRSGHRNGQAVIQVAVRAIVEFPEPGLDGIASGRFRKIVPPDDDAKSKARRIAPNWDPSVFPMCAP